MYPVDIFVYELRGCKLFSNTRVSLFAILKSITFKSLKTYILYRCTHLHKPSEYRTHLHSPSECFTHLQIPSERCTHLNAVPTYKKYLITVPTYISSLCFAPTYQRCLNDIVSLPFYGETLDMAIFITVLLCLLKKESPKSRSLKIAI